MMNFQEADPEEGEIPNPRQLKLEQFSEAVLLFILEVLKVRDAKKEKPRVPLPQ